MPAINAHILTISLIGINGENIAGVVVQISLADPELIYPLGMPTETLYPADQYAVTDENGVAEFSLLPSENVGDYLVVIGPYNLTITMPANDVSFSELGKV